MSYWLGQHLSEQHPQDDPLKDRIWFALQTLLTFTSIFIAFGFFDDWGTRSFEIAGELLAFGTSCLYLLFVRGRWSRIAQGVAGASGIFLLLDVISTLR